MRREDLFLAIGEVEENRLARTENLSASNVTALEEGNMKHKTTKRRPLRLLLVVAVMVAILSSLTLLWQAKTHRMIWWWNLSPLNPVLLRMKQN